MSRPVRPARLCLISGVLVALLGLTGCTAAHESATGTTGGMAGGAGARAPGSEAGTAAADAPRTSATGATSGASGPSTSSAPGREQAPGASVPSVITLPGLDAAPAPAGGPLLAGPAPATAARNGAVVGGFPLRVVPVPKGVTVVSSSVSSQGTHIQLGMQASSAASPDQVLTAYDEALAATGFTPSSTTALAGSTAHTYLHGTDGVVVTVRARVGGGSEITLSGALVTAG